MDQDFIKNKIVNRIKEAEIVPDAPKAVKRERVFQWVFIMMILVIVSLALSFIVLYIADFGPKLVGPERGPRPDKLLVATAPYFWMAIALVFASLGAVLLQHTHLGYRHRFFFWGGLVAVIALFSGALLHQLNMNRHAERIFVDRFPTVYLEVEGQQWERPDEGRLVGTVYQVYQDGFQLTTPDHKVFLVRVTPQTVVRGGTVQEQKDVLVLGENEPQQAFVAHIIRVLGAERTLQRIETRTQTRIQIQTRLPAVPEEQEEVGE